MSLRKAAHSHTRRRVDRIPPPTLAPEQPEPAAGTPEASEHGATRLTPEEREQLIAKAAYYRAENRGFLPGNELIDWLEAEAEIDRLLAR